MKKIYLLVVLLVAVLLSIYCATGKESSNMFGNFYGVWANKDCELVRTGKFSLLFERTGETISATLKLLNSKDNKVTFDTRGVAIFDPVDKQVIIKSKDLLSGERFLIDNDTDNKLKLSRQECIVESAPRKLVVKHKEKIIEELSMDKNKLKLLTPNNKWQNLDLVEKIRVVDPYDMRTANKDNIGACLQEWGLGSSFGKDENGNVTTIVINTNKHAYVFSFSRWNRMDVIYCRAARIRSDNNGTVFAQNIRLMKNPKEFTAWMSADNLELTKEPIIIDDSLFNPNACVFAKNGIYWSLKSFDCFVANILWCS